MRSTLPNILKIIHLTLNIVYSFYLTIKYNKVKPLSLSLLLLSSSISLPSAIWGLGFEFEGFLSSNPKRKRGLYRV